MKIIPTTLLLSLFYTYPMLGFAENLTLMRGSVLAFNQNQGLPTYVHIVKAASKPPGMTMKSYKKPIEDAVNELRNQAVKELKIVGKNACKTPEQTALFDEMDIRLTYIGQYNLPVITLQANIHCRANINAK
ncbi:hypothetical protein NYG22_000160 [Vibrio alginolyticus]|nr:hypothetical protein [Vibrio alginolyticus]